ncbi:MAG: type II toxin-antitoxin system VapC family toxin [Candidatus Eremiobacteraeota bacterium]|nr:type II toxin-antitoxin system VapC family toxin [Candidatus Eremiobacteraeota bacterium]MCW5865870.1 type II toxin-antitoxin system VapC family toxin [Candidatus Eremiobacteraeota bacterium]
MRLSLAAQRSRQPVAQSKAVARRSHSGGGLTLPPDAATYFDDVCERFSLLDLPLQKDDVGQITKLPDVHRDPFDRMLICQTVMQGLTLVTPDPLIHQSPVLVVW